MMFDDKRLVCRDCGLTFLFSVGEQGYYLDKGLLNDPQRCPDCRAARRRSRSAYALLRELTPVTCAGCSTETAVPFVPRQNRPVYCADCFGRVRAAG